MARTDPDTPPDLLLVLCGLVGSGKSTVARALAEDRDATRLEADALRRTLLDREAVAGPQDPFRTFDPELEDRVYARLLREAERLLWSGHSVVLDAGFPTRAVRAAARRLAADHGLGFLLVECRVDPETSLERMAERDRASDDSGWSELFARYQEHYEPVDELDPEEHLVVDTAKPLDRTLATIRERLELAGRRETA